MKCKNCQSEIPDKEKFCPNCGAKVKRNKLPIILISVFGALTLGAAVLLVVIIIFGIIIYNISVSNNICGEDLTWRYNPFTATLTISGEGDMYIPANGDNWYDNTSSFSFLSVHNFMKKVKIEEGVTSIGEYAFAYCDITSVEIPSSVTIIGDFAFSNCYSITSVEIPDGVTTIGEGAFCFCEYLTSIEIPGSVTSIGYDAFSSCNLETIYFGGTEEQWRKFGLDESDISYAKVIFKK